jgi:hypothetical protein
MALTYHPEEEDDEGEDAPELEDDEDFGRHFTCDFQSAPNFSKK